MIKFRNFFLILIIFFFLQCGKNENKVKIENILLFGDSLMSGYGLPKHEHLSVILEKQLKSDGYEIEVYNESISGDTSFDGLNRIDDIFLEKKYELIIIGLGANDMLRGIDTKETRKNLENIINKIQSKKIKILLTGMVASSMRGIVYKKKFDKIFPDLKKKYNLNFMPFLLKDVALKPQYNQSDGIHPNSKGVLIISNNLKEIIIDLI